MRGNAFFVGELINIQVLTINICRTCVNQLLQNNTPENPDEESVKSLQTLFNEI
jgi:hypothetical protein